MASDLHNLFEPDAVLPDQFFSAFSHQDALGPERRLMLAVLQDAVECYQKFALSRTPQGRNEFREARDWIASTDQGWAYSYENICDVLGIDSAYIRRGLRRFGSNSTEHVRRAPKIVPVRLDDGAQMAGEAEAPEALKQAS